MQTSFERFFIPKISIVLRTIIFPTRKSKEIDFLTVFYSIISKFHYFEILKWSFGIAMSENKNFLKKWPLGTLTQGQRFATECENPFGISQWNFATIDEFLQYNFV